MANGEWRMANVKRNVKCFFNIRHSTFHIPHHLSASTGSSLAARRAGCTPKRSPTPVEKRAA